MVSLETWKRLWEGRFPAPEPGPPHACGRPTHIIRTDEQGFRTLKCDACDDTHDENPKRAALAAWIDRKRPW